MVKQKGDGLVEREKNQTRICLVSQWRFDDLGRLPGKPISEALRLAELFDTVVFVAYNSQSRYLSRRIGNLWIYTVPLGLDNTSAINSVGNLLTNLTQMAAFLSKICRLHRVNLIRADNAILGGAPVFVAHLLTGVTYGIWLAGSEEDVIDLRYGKSVITLFLKKCLVLMKKIVFSRAEFILGVSEELIDRNKLASGPTYYLTPNFVDLDKFSPAEKEKQDRQETRFLYVGRLEVEKGIVELLEAIDRVNSRTEFEVMIVGFGSYLNRVLRAASGSERVRYLGKRSHEDMPAVYREADFLILPSLTEGMPAVVLEALASGVPVISSGVGQIPKAILHEKHGLIVRPGNVDALVEALERVLKDSRLVEKMRNAARRRACELSGGYLEFHRNLYNSIRNAGEA